MVDDAEIVLRELEPGDRVTGLSFGAAEFNPLKIFVQKHAKAFASELLAKTYGMFNDNGKLIAYVTLVCGEVSAENGEILGDMGEADYRYKHYPAIKIARLAVDRGYQRTHGLGRKLVEFSLGIAKDGVSSIVGCRFVVLDAKKASVDFYIKCGFRLIDTDENRERSQPVMFLDLKRI